MIVRSRLRTNRSMNHGAFHRVNHIDTYSGMGGLGMTVSEARQFLVSGVGTPEQLALANETYYAAYNAYVKSGTKIDNSSTSTGNGIITQNADGSYTVVQNDPINQNVVNIPAYPGNSADQPTLLTMEACASIDAACVLRNNQRDQDNIVLRQNANNLYNRKICMYDFAINFNAGNVNANTQNCGQYSQTNLPYDPTSLTVIANGSAGNSSDVGKGSTSGSGSGTGAGTVIQQVSDSVTNALALLTGQPLHATAPILDPMGNIISAGNPVNWGLIGFAGLAGLLVISMMTSK